jgi:uncharacterized protein YqhQ
MSFFKALILAVMATLFLTYFFGVSVMEWLNIDLDLNANEAQHQHVIEPLKKISVSAIIAVSLLLLALFVLLSVFGTIMFITVIVVGAFAMLMIGIFWPVLLIAIVIWLITKQSTRRQLT